MRALPLLALLAVGSTSAFARVTETRKIADFAAIDVSGGVTLEVKKGPTSLTIEGDPEVVKAYATDVVGDVLKIHNTAKTWFKSTGDVIVRVTTPSLSRLEASGGVHASLVDVAAPKFSADLSGGVDLSAQKVQLDSLNLEASGGVTVAMSGKARSAKLSLSGGVEVKAKNLEVAEVAVDASGGCNLDITAKDSITGEASGGVGLTVHGKPPKSRVHTSGGADVEYVD